MNKLILFLLVLLLFAHEQLLGQEINNKLVRIESKNIHKKIKSDGELIYNSFRIYFSQNPVLNFCDSIINIDSLKKEEYLELKKHLLGPRFNAKKNWIVEICKKYDIKIRDLNGNKWADRICLEYFADGSVYVCAYFGKDKIIINR